MLDPLSFLTLSARLHCRSLRVLKAEAEADAAAQADFDAKREIRVAHQEKEAAETAMEELEAGGKGTYMKHDAEVQPHSAPLGRVCLTFGVFVLQWYRKWQYRKEYSDNRDKRYVKNYHSFKDPSMRRMQMQMMHGM